MGLGEMLGEDVVQITEAQPRDYRPTATCRPSAHDSTVIQMLNPPQRFPAVDPNVRAFDATMAIPHGETCASTASDPATCASPDRARGQGLTADEYYLPDPQHRHGRPVLLPREQRRSDSVTHRETTDHARRTTSERKLALVRRALRTGAESSRRHGARRSRRQPAGSSRRPSRRTRSTPSRPSSSASEYLVCAACVGPGRCRSSTTPTTASARSRPGGWPAAGSAGRST